MQHLKRMISKKSEDGVSPVVGVMLMLVVTIIIAAVVSGFSGGLVGGQQKSPTLSMDVKVINTGSYIGSGFVANVRSVSEPINTADIKLVTTWTTTMKNDRSADLSGTQQAITNGSTFSGGNTSVPFSGNIGGYDPGMHNGASSGWAVTYINRGGVTAPFGMGAEIQSDQKDPFIYPTAYFGNYTLQPGVSLFAFPFGSASGMATAGAPGCATTAAGGYNNAVPYAYVAGTSGGYSAGGTDPAIAVLGGGWEQLRAGDIVHVRMIYTPTGATIFSKDVAVAEG